MSAKILIGTPAYGGMVHTDYVNSLLEFKNAGLDVSLASTNNESLITRARNSIISWFHHQPEYTHLLFLDADIRLSAAGLQTLVNHDVDVIGAPVPLKGSWPDGSPQYNISGFESQVGNNLFTTRHMGTAVMLLNRRAVQALVDQARRDGLVYRYGQGYDQNRTLDDMEIFDIFRVGAVEGEYLSEDYWVCRQLWAMDIPVHVVNNVAVIHHGMHAFRPKVEKRQ